MVCKNKILIFLLLGLFLISFTSASLNDDIVSYWKFDQTSGSVLDELNTNNGTAENSPTRGVTGKINKTFTFDGIDQRVDTGFQPDIENRSIAMWYKLIDATPSGFQVSMGYDGTTASTYGSFGAGHATNGTSCISQSSNSACYASNTDWTHIVISQNNTHVNFFLNGVLVQTDTVTTGVSGDVPGQLRFSSSRTPDSYFGGNIDEVGFWNRSLTENEVSNLYNIGNGLTYPFIENIITITLISPENDTTISDLGTNFTVIGDVTSFFNTTNITYYIWDVNGTLHNQSTILLNQNQTFNETLFIDEFTLGNFIWNAEICYENSTSSDCMFADNNFTFNVDIFRDISVSYDIEITEGALNTINRTISIFPGNILTSALLEYNGTNYSTSLIFSDGVYIVGTSIVAPTVNLDTNFTFKFYYLINGVYHESEEANQTVLNTLFGICGGVSNDSLFNLFLVDEAIGNSIIGDIEISAEIVSVSSDEVVGNLNNTFNSVDNVSICFTPPSVYSLYYLNAEIRYSSPGYASEFYFIQKSDLTNFPTNITLYDLNLTDSTEFLITYKNNDFISVEGAIVQLQRRFIGEDVFKTVEAPITADGGKAVVHIDLNTNQYRASIVKDGVVLDFFDDIVFSCDNELSGDCQKSLDGRVNPNNDIPIEDLTDFSYSVSVNEDDQTITVLFAVPSGVPSSINILLNQIDTFGNLTSCNTTVITSAGSITCDYTDSIENNILELSISKNGVQLAIVSYSNNPELDMDGINFFIIFLFMISLVGMAISSPEWMLIISVMVLMIGGTLLLVSGMNLVIGLGALAWLVIAIGIIIFKMAKQEDR